LAALYKKQPKDYIDKKAYHCYKKKSVAKRKPKNKQTAVLATPVPHVALSPTTAVPESCLDSIGYGSNFGCRSAKKQALDGNR